MRSVLVFLIALLAAVAVAQSTPQSGTVQVELLNTINTKKAKVGDELKARTMTLLCRPAGCHTEALTHQCTPIASHRLHNSLLDRPQGGRYGAPEAFEPREFVARERWEP